MVVLDESTTYLQSAYERHIHHSHHKQAWLEEQLSKEGTRIIATQTHPIEFCCSDIALYINNSLLAVYRDIPPVGWILPGGCPESLEELLDPQRVGEREFSEEILIVNPQNKIAYMLFPHYENIMRTNLKKQGMSGFKIVYPAPTPLRRKSQGERIVIFWKGREITLRVPWFINTEIGTITIIRAFSVQLPEVVLFDCEVNKGNLLNRPVGLFKGGELIKMFVGGRKIFPQKWATKLHSSFAGQ